MVPQIKCDFVSRSGVVKNMDLSRWGLIVLAAGEGKRMRSSIPKVLLPAWGKPIIQYLLEEIEWKEFGQRFLVVSPSMEDLMQNNFGQEMTIVVQREPKGTAHAASTVFPLIQEGIDWFLVLYADMPLLRGETIFSFLSQAEEKHSPLSFLTSIAPRPAGFGRVVRDEKGEPLGIVEEKDCSPQEKKISEVCLGVFAFQREPFREIISVIDNRNAQKEYYLTDAVRVARERGYRPEAFVVEWDEQFLNVNTPADFSKAILILKERKIASLWDEGVKILDPSTTYVDWDVVMEEDVWLYPGVVIEGKSVIAKGARIGPFSRVSESRVGRNSSVEYSVVEESFIGEEVKVGPFSHLRPGTKLERGVKVGNFVEVKNSQVGEETKALHLSYLGDAQIGKKVNIGAGTITCNYDGVKKNPTFIEDEVFIGSNNSLVAPVSIGRGAYTAAGSTITQDVPPYSLGIGRARQKNIEDWAKRKIRRNKD